MTIVELLATHDEGTLTLADIVRRTGQSRATAHAVISELTAHQWVTRSPEGTFGLGPALIRLAGRITRADHLGHLAGPVLNALADELGIACFLARRVGEHATVTDSAYAAPTITAAGPPNWPAPGASTELRPPICREFIAWEAAPVRAAWINRAPAALRTRLGLALDAVAQRGVSLERMTDAHTSLLTALDSLDPATIPTAVRGQVGELLSALSVIDYLPDELTDGPTHPVMTIGAPVFGADGHVTASVVACPHRALDTVELNRFITATRAAATQLCHSGPTDLR